MNTDTEVVIIGAGIGGLAVGALLAHGGRKVLVLEGNPFIGGRCTSYEKEGFIIDVFVHLVARCEKGPFGQIMRAVGRPDGIRWWHATPDSKPILVLDGEIYPYPDLSFCTREDLEDIYRRGFGLSEGDVQAAMRILDSILKMGYEETVTLDQVPYSRWLRGFTSNPIILAMEHQKTLLSSVVTSREASAGEMIRMFQNVQRDANIGYPLGGCISIPRALADVIAAHGGEVRTSAPVECILVEGGRARGVRLAGGQEIRASTVISNAGIRETALRMVGESLLPPDYLERVRGLSTGKLVEETPMGMVYMKLALDEPVVEAPIILCNVKEGAFQGSRDLMQGLMLDRPPEDYKGINSFIPVTSNMDPHVAPPGRQLVNFYGLAPPNSANWQRWVDYHLGFLYGLYPEMRRHVMWYDFSTLNRVQKFSGRLYPDIIGIAQSVGQTGRDRPSPVTPVEGLYLVGSDVGRDNVGTELAAESALRVAEMIL